jgi:N-methylhydantoinase A
MRLSACTLRAPGAACAPRTTPKAFFDTWREVPVYALDALESGHLGGDPAVVEVETTTLVINSDDKLTAEYPERLDIQVG